MSSWPGRSRVLRNPGASPQLSAPLLDALKVFCEIDDEMWTPPADTADDNGERKPE
jgi:hypothetical protein